MHSRDYRLLVKPSLFRREKIPDFGGGPLSSSVLLAVHGFPFHGSRSSHGPLAPGFPLFQLRFGCFRSLERRPAAFPADFEIPKNAFRKILLNGHSQIPGIFLEFPPIEQDGRPSIDLFYTGHEGFPSHISPARGFY